MQRQVNIHLVLRNQRLYSWEERNRAYVKPGDYFLYHNLYNGDTEFFQFNKPGAGYYPIDKTDNAWWYYVGRYPQKGEALSPALPVHHWDDNNRQGKKGWLYYYDAKKYYFILKNDGPYWYFPVKPEDNSWWQFVGYHP